MRYSLCMTINPSWTPSPSGGLKRHMTENSVSLLSVWQGRCPTPCLEIIPPYSPDPASWMSPKGICLPCTVQTLQHQTQTCLSQPPSPPTAPGSALGWDISSPLLPCYKSSLKIHFPCLLCSFLSFLHKIEMYGGPHIHV